MRHHNPYFNEDIYYPDSDGKPMAENTRQLRWIVSLYSNLKNLFKNQEVFVAADLFWYPVEGDPRTVVAPDVMVAFDRPDADRLSYRQWKEDNIPPRVVIEVLSPSNTTLEMIDKQHFFARYGVEEFLIIDPDKETFTFFLREGEKLVSPDFPPANWQSPSLGIWFRQVDGKLQVFYPDGTTPFKTLEDSQAEVEIERQRAESEKQRAELENQRAESEKQRAELENQRAESEKQRAEEALSKLALLEQKLRDLGELE